MGKQHKRFVEEWVTEAGESKWPVFLETRKDYERRKYGRGVATIIRRNDVTVLNDDIFDKFGEAVRSDM